MEPAVAEMNGKEVDGKIIEASIAQRRDESVHRNPPSRTLFVKNLTGLHSRELLEAFRRYGPVEVRRKLDESARLVYQDVETATKALEMHRGKVGQNVLMVEYAQEWKPQQRQRKGRKGAAYSRIQKVPDTC